MIHARKWSKDDEFASWFPRCFRLGTTRSTENELLLIPHVTYEDLLSWTMGVRRYQCGY